MKKLLVLLGIFLCALTLLAQDSFFDLKQDNQQAEKISAIISPASVQVHYQHNGFTQNWMVSRSQDFELYTISGKTILVQDKDDNYLDIKMAAWEPWYAENQTEIDFLKGFNIESGDSGGEL